MAQNWNDVLNYIKTYLSADINQLEISDTELIEHLKNTALKLISIYDSYHYWYTLDESKLIDEKQSIFIIKQEELPKGSEVIKIIRFAPKNLQNVISTIPDTPINMDSLISYSFESLKYENSVNVLPELIGTKYIKFDMNWNDIKQYFPAKIELGLTYPNLELMNFELYQKYFKPLCLAETKILLGEKRSKFQQLQTPSGQIPIRSLDLKQEGLQEKQYILQQLEGEIDYVPLIIL